MARAVKNRAAGSASLKKAMAPLDPPAQEPPRLDPARRRF
jgi:hypothetical protein